MGITDIKPVTVYNHPAFVPKTMVPVQKIVNSDGRLLPSLGEVLFLPLNDIMRLRTEYLNLICASALPDTANLDLITCMQTLDKWTAFVKSETDRQMHKFRRNPADYENSEAYFRMLVMITALQRDIGVRYNPDSRSKPYFWKSSEGFLHGLLTGDKMGTCANMPVLYASIGRKLGYPIYLVGAKGHLFCRWHSMNTGERFNIEGSGYGLGVFPDEYYKSWPHQITEAEVYHGIYLRNLEPIEELAHFMMTRGHCLKDQGNLLDAMVAYSHAHRLAPTDPHAMSFLLATLNVEIDQRAEGKLPCTYRQAEIFNRNDCAPLAKYTVDERYTLAVGGVNIDETKPGRMASNN